MSEEIITAINQLQIQNREEIRNRLIFLLNELMNKNFTSLVRLLYQVDVSEKKINEVLKSNRQEDSAPLIADLIIERQIQKLESRKHFSPNKDSGNEERW